MQFLQQKQNSLYWALKIAATGNILDSAINNNLNIKGCIEEELSKEFKICDINIFKEKLASAKKILIITCSNIIPYSGRIPYDKKAIEEINNVLSIVEIDCYLTRQG